MVEVWWLVRSRVAHRRGVAGYSRGTDLLRHHLLDIHGRERCLRLLHVGDRGHHVTGQGRACIRSED